jgi:hypothetical protein
MRHTLSSRVSPWSSISPFKRAADADEAYQGSGALKEGNPKA